MQDIIEPIIHKAALADLGMALKNSGLAIGDAAALHLTDDGRVAVYAQVQRRVFFVRRRREAQIGHLGPKASQLLEPFLRRGDRLRVRIVGLTPEHLATDGNAEMHVSVWGTLPHNHPAFAPRKSPDASGQPLRVLSAKAVKAT